MDYIRENRAPSILLIENSCSVSLIGDDIEGIAAKAKLPFSVIGMDSGGLSGKIISILTGGQVCEKPFGYNILKKIC